LHYYGAFIINPFIIHQFQLKNQHIARYWTKHLNVLPDIFCTSRSSWVKSNTREITIVLCSVYSAAAVRLVNVKCHPSPDEIAFMPIHYFDKFLLIKLFCSSRLYSLIIRYALECHTSCRNAVCDLKYYKYCICI